MKKTILALSLSAMAVFGAFNKADAQNEVTITYSIKMDGLPPEYAAMAEGQEQKLMIKNGKSRMDITSAFMSMTTVTDDKGNTLMLMESPMTGAKNFTRISKADLEKKKEGREEPKIIYKDEKKTIAGYECKKAVIEIKDSKGEVVTNEVWYTDKIGGGKSHSQYKGLKGVEMESTMSLGNGMTRTVTASAVSTAAIPDSKFQVSTDGYTEVTADQLKGMSMGGQ